MQQNNIRKRRITFHKPLCVFLNNEVAKVQNLSQSGCLLSTRKWSRVDQSAYEMSIVPSTGDPIPAVGRIVRANMVPSETGMVYEIGIQFDQGDPNQQAFHAWFMELIQSREVRDRVHQ